MTAPSSRTAFAPSYCQADKIVDFLAGDQAAALTHAQVEDWIATNGRDLLRQFFQDYLDLRSLRETRCKEIVDAQGIPHNAVEKNHGRPLTTRFGNVVVRRLAYRHDGRQNLYPMDARLNLPREQYSHGLRRLAANEASRGSFTDAQAAIEQSTGLRLGKRQVEELAQRAAQDFNSFYAEAPSPAADPGDLLVLSADGKGIVMRPEALRPATAKAAEASTQKMPTRLSKSVFKNQFIGIPCFCLRWSIYPYSDGEKKDARAGCGGSLTGA